MSLAAAVMAQWADLGTFLLASRIHPGGESNPLFSTLPVELVVVAKIVGVAMAVVMAQRLTGRRRSVGVRFALGMGVLGSLVNVGAGLI